MIEIIQKEDKILRKTSKPIAIKDIKTSKIQNILADMKEAMNSQDDSVAIAAPQISVLLRIFIVSKKVFETPENETFQDSNLETRDSKKDLVFINPKIIKISKKREEMEEGCLSVRWLYGHIKRSTNITVQAYNEKGEKFTRGAGGLLAQIFQHEIDHLNGILFIDKANNIEEILPKK